MRFQIEGRNMLAKRAEMGKTLAQLRR